jgi:PPOX class probable F420-dependent enzyme
MASLSDSMREILEARRYATLATHNEDGSIHTTPVWYLFENGRFYVESPSSSRKARNAAARPDATIMVDIRQPGGESWVYASGRVEILRGDASREANSRILRRYLTQEAIIDWTIYNPVVPHNNDMESTAQKANRGSCPGRCAAARRPKERYL